MGQRILKAQGTDKAVQCSLTHHGQILRKHEFISTREKFWTHSQKVHTKAAI
jgi:hypothetical protein